MKPPKFFSLACLLLGLAFSALASTNQVPLWDRFETALVNTNTYADPYREVTLNVTYTKPDSSTVNFWGFYDGSNTWRARFMPDQVGVWTYAANFSDGSPGETNSFECVGSDLPGLIGADETNPYWFGFKGGRHTLIRSFHVGDRFFASNWAATNRTAFLDWAQAQGYNMLAIASHYLNRNEAGRGLGWNTPNLWDGPARTLHAEEYQEMEVILNDITARRMMAFPFSGFFGKSSDFPTNHADQELYLRYTLARVGPYWNLVFNIAGPEPLLLGDELKYQNAMSTNDISRLGTLIKSLDVFGHLVTEHNVTEFNAFSNQVWETYTTLQGPKTTNRTSLATGVLGYHVAKPLYALELLWPGNTLGHPVYTDTDIRKNGFVLMMCAAALNFGDMDGNSSSGFSGSMDFADKIQSRHDIIKKVWDFFETKQFWRMKPRPDLVNKGWCLADPGREYLVYLQSTGTVSIVVSNGPFTVQWINATNTLDQRSGGPTTNGSNLASPTNGQDWLVHLQNPLEAWRSSYFTNALAQQADNTDTADPDLDGVRNLAEYFFALNPTAADVAGSGGNLPSLFQTNDTLRFQYVRRQGTLPLTLSTEFSSDLIQWGSGILGIDYDDPTAVPHSNETETVSFRMLQAGPLRFVRARTSSDEDPLAAWQKIQFPTNTSSIADDFDSDGLKNLAEFYFATDPNQSDAGSSHLPLTSVSDDGPHLRFVRQQHPGPATLCCEFSTDLAQWHSGVWGVDYDGYTVTSNGDGTETINLRLIATATARFARLKTLLAQNIVSGSAVPAAVDNRASTLP